MAGTGQSRENTVAVRPEVRRTTLVRGGGGEVGDVIWDLTGLTGRQNAGRVGRGIKGEDRGD